MSTFRRSVFHLLSNPVVRFFFSFVNFRHCRKTWSGVSSEVSHVRIPFGTILKRARPNFLAWNYQRTFFVSPGKSMRIMLLHLRTF
jgi:hypothetical protein